MLPSQARVRPPGYPKSIVSLRSSDFVAISSESPPPGYLLPVGEVDIGAVLQSQARVRPPGYTWILCQAVLKGLLQSQARVRPPGYLPVERLERVLRLISCNLKRECAPLATFENLVQRMAPSDVAISSESASPWLRPQLRSQPRGAGGCNLKRESAPLATGCIDQAHSYS